MSDKDFDSIAADLVETMPEVSEHAILEHEAQERKNSANIEEAQNPAPVTTETGLQYDPKTHMISPKTGKIIKKKQSGAKSKVSTGSQTSTQTAAPVNTEGQARAAGKVAANALIGLSVGLFGDEFIPEKTEVRDERVYLESAFGDYFVATGQTDFPPSIALMIATGNYVLPRLTRPQTKGKLGAFKDFLISKFFSWRGKKTLEKAEKNAEKN